MKGLIVLGCIGFLAFHLLKGDPQLNPQLYSKLINEGVAEQNTLFDCSDKAQCLVVYLSPWCPACQSFKAQIMPTFIKQVEQSYKDTGVKFVIGRDKMDNINRMGKQIKYPYIVDETGAMFKGLEGNAVPSFFVVDRAGKITEAEAGMRAKGRTKEEAMTNFLNNLLL